MSRDMAIVKEIKDLIEGESWFQLDGDVEDFEGGEDLMFTTRENGDVGSETYGQEDFDEGQRVLLLVMSKYGHLFQSFEVNTCDEWVNLEFQLK